MGLLGVVVVVVVFVIWKGLRYFDWILEFVLIFMDRELGLGLRVSSG